MREGEKRDRSREGKEKRTEPETVKMLLFEEIFSLFFWWPFSLSLLSQVFVSFFIR